MIPFVEVMTSLASNITPKLSDFSGFRAFAVQSLPVNGCDSIARPPISEKPILNETERSKWVALVAR